jgi:hypothetical protein
MAFLLGFSHYQSSAAFLLANPSLIFFAVCRFLRWLRRELGSGARPLGFARFPGFFRLLPRSFGFGFGPRFLYVLFALVKTGPFVRARQYCFQPWRAIPRAKP